MRYTTTRVPARDPRPRRSVHTTVVGVILASLSVPALVMAVLHPAAAAGVVALAGAAWPALAALRRLYRTRRRRGRTRQFCIPRAGICVEA